MRIEVSPDELLRSGFRRTFPPLLALVAIVALWEIASILGDNTGFVGFSRTVSALSVLSTQTSFWLAIGETVLLSVGGLLIGLTGAVAFGIAAGRSEFVRLSTQGLFQVARFVPTIVIIPLFIVTLGNSLQMIIALTATVVSLKLVIFIIRGTRDSREAVDDSIRVLGLSRIRALVFVTLPAILPSVFVGLRLTIFRAYGVVVLVGLVAGGLGVGGELALAKATTNSEVIYAFVVVAAVIGTGFFYFFLWLERRVIFWPRPR